MMREPDRAEAAALTILIIDDQASTRHLLIAGLAGYRNTTFIEASDGDEALRLVVERRPGIIICDVQMQPVDGIAFLKTIRGYQDQAMRQTPVFIMTGVATPDVLAAARQSGANGILVKPISIPVLKARIDAALRR
jgi:two-component system, chemotaxis family, chemotaxis protein CheY